MKVLLLHNAYQHRGGEDSVLEAEHSLLAAAGVEVVRHVIENRDIQGLAAKVQAFRSVQNNSRAIAPVLDLVRKFRPDVVHLHNFFPLLSPGIHIALAAEGFPIVQTLHNYRLLCANGMFLRDDRVCEDCLTKSRLSAIRHRCYRGSVAGSAAVLAMQNGSIRSDRWVNSVSRFITLTEFGRQKFIDNGLPAERMTVKANSVPDPQLNLELPRKGALFVGRIGAGKGVDLLLEAWRGIPDADLTIIGDGPDLNRLRRNAPANVSFAGRKSSAEVSAAMARAECLVLPSIWYEGFPMTLVEAFSCGLPAIASRIGGIPEIVREAETGFLFEPGDVADLQAAVAGAFANTDRLHMMSNAVRREYEMRYSQAENLAALMTIYQDAITDRTSRYS